MANPAQTETAEFALMKLKDEIVLVEGKRIKNHYMKYLGIDALIIGAIASIVLGICFYFTRWIGCISVLCIIIGALTGTWVSFGARKFEIEFEDLASLEKDKMTPVIRLIYIAVASLIFALLMNVGLIDVKIGNVDISKAFTDIKPALVIGVLCGLVLYLNHNKRKEVITRPRTKGSKNRPKTNNDYASKIVEKQETIASLNTEIASIQKAI